jgi:5,6,7,8-tetrahydromethanopterin hydro-lyase
MWIGEAFVGSGPEAAHLNTVLGPRDGAVGVAFATGLATPREGHASFLVIAQPNRPVVPPTLFVNKAMIANETHARLTWGPAQLGVASGVLDALAEGVIPLAEAASLVLIAAVWVDPLAADEDAVYANNRAATTLALRRGFEVTPPNAALLELRDTPLNGYYTPPTLRDNE